MSRNILKMTFDEWLLERFDMTENRLKAALAESLYDRSDPDRVIDIYKSKFRHEQDIYALDTIDLTFVEFLKGYHKLTPESFHELCEATGTLRRHEEMAIEFYRKQYFKHQENLGTNPFEK